MVEHRHPTEKPHPQPWFYVAVGIILTVITAIEVAVFYLDIAGALMMPILIGLSVIKFWMVVAFFMHLKYDHKLFTVFFTGGLILAVGVVLGLIALFQNFDIGDPNIVKADAQGDVHTEKIETTVQSTPTPTPGSSHGSTSTTDLEGSQIFVAKGCGSCHTIDGVSGAGGAVGPELNGLAARAASRDSGLSSEEYIRQSVETPGSFVVDGYSNIMPPLRGTMTDSEFESLMSFLFTLE